MTLLAIIESSCDRLGLARPTTVIANTDQNVRVLLGLAKEEGRQLARRHPWQRLTKEYTFATAASDYDYALPSDFDRMLADTFFNRTQRRRVSGPISEEDWQQAQASLTTYVNQSFRFRGNMILLTPTPSAIETIAYEYVSTQWCEAEDGTDQSTWAADTDVAFLDEELHVLGLVWRFLASRGFDYAEAMQKYEVEVYQAILRDGARPRLTCGPANMDRIPRAPRAPETLVF